MIFRTGKKIFKYVVFDILRSRLVITYAVLLFILSFSVIHTGRDAQKAIASLLNIVLLLVPLVSIVFGTIHYYNSREFIEMLLSLPVRRRSIFWAEYLGLSASVSVSYLAGTGIPLVIYGITTPGIYLLVSGVFLSFVFTALAFLSSVINSDKSKGIGVSLMIWLYLSVLFDGIVLMLYLYLSDYPLQKTVIILSALNPVDLARIVLLLQLDISALMGYTGVTFHNFFGSTNGLVFSLVFLMAWVIFPALLALRSFKKKNF
jgi:Cu-processing system permease protein